jgi:exodeoxyribonuclease VII large subunit
VDESGRRNPRAAPFGDGRGPEPATAPRIWQVGALCRAIADFLDARLNPVAVRGEISGFSRASSGHFYFTLKDRRASCAARCSGVRPACWTSFPPTATWSKCRAGSASTKPRGDLQLVVESLRRAGQGAWYEQFLRLKAKLEAEGLFDSSASGLAAAATRHRPRHVARRRGAARRGRPALRRRAPHVPVVLAPAAVQGSQSAPDLIRALEALYRWPRGDGRRHPAGARRRIDRGPLVLQRRAAGAHHRAQPGAAGVRRRPRDRLHHRRLLRRPAGADADRRRRTGRQPRTDLAGALDDAEQLQRRRSSGASTSRQPAARPGWRAHLGRPSARTGAAAARSDSSAQRLRHALSRSASSARAAGCTRWPTLEPRRRPAGWCAPAMRCIGAELRLQLLDPRLVLQRGYALLVDADGAVVTRAAQTRPGQRCARPLRRARLI